MNEWMNEWTNESMKLSDLILFQKCSERLRFFSIFMWNQAPATVSCRFCQPHLPKVLQTCHVLRILCEIELWLQSCARLHVLSTTCADRGPKPGNRDPTSATAQATFPEKNTGFRARESCQAWSSAPDLLHFSTTWCWCGWHDDVVDMMVRMLPMTIVRNSEVF